MENFTKTNTPQFNPAQGQQEEYEKFKNAQEFTERYIKKYFAKDPPTVEEQYPLLRLIEEMKTKIASDPSLYSLKERVDKKEEKDKDRWEEAEEYRKLAIVILTIDQDKDPKYNYFRETITDPLRNTLKKIVADYTSDLDFTNPGKYPDEGLNLETIDFTIADVKEMRKGPSLREKLSRVIKNSLSKK